MMTAGGEEDYDEPCLEHEQSPKGKQPLRNTSDSWIVEEEARLAEAEYADDDDDDSLFTDDADHDLGGEEEMEEDEDDDEGMVVEDPFRQDLPAHGALLDLAEPAETPCILFPAFFLSLDVPLETISLDNILPAGSRRTRRPLGSPMKQ